MVKFGPRDHEYDIVYSRGPSNQTQWLMVIDNTDDTQLFSQPQHMKDSIKAPVSATRADVGLGRYIPEFAYGLILTTSRDKQTALSSTLKILE